MYDGEKKDSKSEDNVLLDVSGVAKEFRSYWITATLPWYRRVAWCDSFGPNSTENVEIQYLLTPTRGELRLVVDRNMCWK